MPTAGGGSIDVKRQQRRRRGSGEGVHAQYKIFVSLLGMAAFLMLATNRNRIERSVLSKLGARDSFVTSDSGGNYLDKTAPPTAAPWIDPCEDGSWFHSVNATWSAIDNLVSGNKNYSKARVSGGIFLYPRQSSILAFLLRRVAVHRSKTNRRITVCETGFGAGHSSALFLSVSRNIDLITFDTFDRPYQLPALDLLKRTYRNQTIVHVKGDSCKTVPAFFRNNNQISCDFLHGSSLCRSDNLDLVRYAVGDSSSAMCGGGVVLTSTAMFSLADDPAVYFGGGVRGEDMVPQPRSVGSIGKPPKTKPKPMERKKAQWRTLRDGGCISNVTCYEEEPISLGRNYVFAPSGEGKNITHAFCIAVTTGRCSESSHWRGSAVGGASRIWSPVGGEGRPDDAGGGNGGGCIYEDQSTPPSVVSGVEVLGDFDRICALGRVPVPP